MPKRSRFEGQEGGSARARAIAAAIRIRNKFPLRDYGVSHHRRGTAENLALFGESYRAANAAQKADRKRYGYYGRGMYTGKGGFWSALGNIESIGDRFLTKGVPRMIGAANQVKKFLGKGSYVPESLSNHNNLVMDQAGFMGGGQISHFSGSTDETGSITVSHKEYIGDIFAPGVAGGGAVSFSNQVFALNPGLTNTFPWLSQIAANYDEYEFCQLLFHYRSTTTDIGNSATGQCGTIILCTNYNSSSPPFTDKQGMIEYAHAHSCKVTEHMTHGVECDKRKMALSNVLYTRSNPVVTGQDLKTYDHGLFQVAVANCPTAYNGFPIGELWVEYVVRLAKPKLFVTRGLDIDLDQFCGVNGTCSAKNPLGTANNFLTAQQNNIGCLVDVSVSGIIKITFPSSFTGPVSIMLHYCSNNFANTAILSGQNVASLTGNVFVVKDLYASSSEIWAIGSSDPSGYIGFPDTSAVSTTTVAAPSFYYSEYHYFVRQATNGVNNTVAIIMNTTVNTSIVGEGQGMLRISAYQSLGNVGAGIQGGVQTTNTVWVNPSGVVTIP